MMRSLFAAAAAAAIVSSAFAAYGGPTKFDGSWLVDVHAGQPNCHDYALKVEVEGGKVTELKLRVDLGGKAADIADALSQASGGIDPHGAVAMTLTRGPEVISVSGALDGTSGGGSWVSPADHCSGRWHAKRSS